MHSSPISVRRTLAAAAIAVVSFTAAAKAETYNLKIGEIKLNVTGQERTALAINGTVPGPTLRFKEGEDVVINVTNTLAVDSSIHWHGLILPYRQDGVPGISFDGIKPGTTHTYRFPVRQSGTYWYHSHSGLQEQAGVYGSIVIEPTRREPFRFDRECVVVLSDWEAVGVRGAGLDVVINVTNTLTEDSSIHAAVTATPRVSVNRARLLKPPVSLRS